MRSANTAIRWQLLQLGLEKPSQSRALQGGF
jgi:hypothetical protein